MLTFFLAYFALFSCIQAQPHFVLEIFRHGARAPISPQFDGTWPFYGELTNVGMRMHYVLGKALNAQYPHIFDPFSSTSINVKSTDVNRTIMSAYSQLYGLYQYQGGNFNPEFPMNNTLPPYNNTADLNDAQAKLKDIPSYLPFNTQPVPVHVIPDARDELLVIGGYNCPNAPNWQNSRSNDTNAQNIYNSLSNITNMLQTNHNITITSMWDYFYLGDTLVCNYVANRTLPNNIEPFSEVFNGSIFAFQWFTNYMFGGAEELIPLYSFTLLNQIYTWFSQITSGQNSYSAILLSAHDTTLLTLLGAFGIITPNCLYQNYLSTTQGSVIPYPNCTYPSFASQVIFEFYNTSQPYFQVYYEGLPIPICGNSNNSCTLPQFRSYIQEITGGFNQYQYNNQCGLITTHSDNDATIALLFAASSTFLAVAVLIVYSQRDKGNKKNKVIEPNKQRLMA